jgi:hypothetical protein
LRLRKEVDDRPSARVSIVTLGIFLRKHLVAEVRNDDAAGSMMEDAPAVRAAYYRKIAKEIREIVWQCGTLRRRSAPCDVLHPSTLIMGWLINRAVTKI